MNYSQEELSSALEYLSRYYPDERINNEKAIGSSPNVLKIEDELYKEMAIKRSNFRNVVYSSCCFSNVAFTGSVFDTVYFQKCTIDGNSFANCSFFNSEFKAEQKLIYKGNNFSQSNFTKSILEQMTFQGCGFLQSVFHKSALRRIRFLSNTMEGSVFTNCELTDTDFGSTGVDFIEFSHSTFKNVIFPFYQFAYIIGAADCLKESAAEIKFQAGDKLVSSDEYLEQSSKLIMYYWDRGEYFPACNLQMMIGNLEESISLLMDGINASLKDLDMRMIRNYCRLAKNLGIMNGFLMHRIRNVIEDTLTKRTLSPEQVNECIVNYGDIHRILMENDSRHIGLNVNIRTNVDKKNENGVRYVNDLCNRLNDALSMEGIDQTGFSVAVSNFSPFEIVVDVICAVGALATISQLIWDVISRHRSRLSVPMDYIKVHPELNRRSLGTRIDLCKEELLHVKDKYSKEELDQYIEEITQRLKTDLEEFYDQDILIFKKDNSSSPT